MTTTSNERLRTPLDTAGLSRDMFATRIGTALRVVA
jgi:hypothetical protein